MNPKIVEYIHTNRDRYTREAITDQLVAAGHDRADVDATWAELAAASSDPDRTIGPRFWRYFWIWVAATYIVTFLAVVLATGMLTGGGGGGIVALIYAVALGLALLAAWGVVAATRPARLSPVVAMSIGGIVPLLFLFLVAGSCYSIMAPYSGLPPGVEGPAPEFPGKNAPAPAEPPPGVKDPPPSSLVAPSSGGHLA